MRIPITRYGQPQVTIVVVALLALMALSFALLRSAPVTLVCVEAVLAVVLGWGISFFRDPLRRVPDGPKLFVSPADGKVVGVEEVDEPLYVGEPTVKVSIFLSVFNVHINRAACAGVVEMQKHTPGKFYNALRADSGTANESNAIGLKSADGGAKILIRQIAGVIARRIVWDCKPGDALERGQQFGMIKFGSRTELYVPARCVARLDVKVGDKVKAGLTVLGALK